MNTTERGGTMTPKADPDRITDGSRSLLRSEEEQR